MNTSKNKEEELVFAGYRTAQRGLTYSRTEGPQRKKLETELCSLYDAKSSHKAHVFPSGMTAISCVLSSLCEDFLDLTVAMAEGYSLMNLLKIKKKTIPRVCSSNNDFDEEKQPQQQQLLGNTPPTSPEKMMKIVYGNELYCEVPRVIKRQVETHRGKIFSQAVPIRDHDAILKLFKEGPESHDEQDEKRSPPAAATAPVRVFYFESCTNPSGELFDFSLIPKLKKLRPDCIFVCDNTWLSGMQLNPLKLGCDIVVESMTKYISGGTCVGGHCIVPAGSSINATVRSWINSYGIFVGDDHCKMFLHGLSTLKTRMKMHSRKAAMLAKMLDDEKEPCFTLVDEDENPVSNPIIISRVLHLSLESHPSHSLAKRMMKKEDPSSSSSSPSSVIPTTTTTTVPSPGVLLIHIGAAKEKVAAAAQAHLRDGSKLEFKTSFGGPSSRIDPWSLSSGLPTKFDVTANKAGAAGTWVRFSVGYSDSVADVIAALASFLKEIFSPNKVEVSSKHHDSTVAVVKSSSFTTPGMVVTKKKKTLPPQQQTTPSFSSTTVIAVDDDSDDEITTTTDDQVSSKRFKRGREDI